MKTTLRVNFCLSYIFSGAVINFALFLSTPVISIEEPQCTWKVFYKWPIWGQIETVFLAEVHLNCKLNKMPWKLYAGSGDRARDGDGALLSSVCCTGKSLQTRACGSHRPPGFIHALLLSSSTNNSIIILNYIIKLMESFFFFFFNICWGLQALKRGFKESNWLCLLSDTEAQFSVQESIKNSREKSPKCI